MDPALPASRHEPRWPVALAVVAVIGVLAMLPGRLSVLPEWFIFVVGVVVLAPMAAVVATSARPRWVRVERIVILTFFVLATAATLSNLVTIVHTMIRKSSDLTGLQLLASSIAVWLSNVTMFSLLYWQMDRGGPETRLHQTGIRPDWLFPQDTAGEEWVPPGWRPVYADYLHLAFSTSTAFSTTEVAPLTIRAKLLMMLEAMISLMIIAMVGARAINILGG